MGPSHRTLHRFWRDKGLTRWRLLSSCRAPLTRCRTQCRSSCVYQIMLNICACPNSSPLFFGQAYLASNECSRRTLHRFWRDKGLTRWRLLSSCRAPLTRCRAQCRSSCVYQIMLNICACPNSSPLFFWTGISRFKRMFPPNASPVLARQGVNPMALT